MGAATTVDTPKSKRLKRLRMEPASPGHPFDLATSRVKQPRRKRQEKQIDSEQLRALAMIHCTVKEAAAVLGVHHSTLDNLLRDDPYMRGVWNDGQEQGCASLRRKTWALADRCWEANKHLRRVMLKEKIDDRIDVRVGFQEAEQIAATLTNEELAEVLALTERFIAKRLPEGEVIDVTPVPEESA